MACMCFFFWCLSISQYSSAQMHGHTQATHTQGMVRDVSVLQCTWIEQVSYLSSTHTHTHTRQTQSSRSKPDRFDMLSFSIPKGEEMCVCVSVFVSLVYNIIVYSYLEGSFNWKLQVNKCNLFHKYIFCFYSILDIIAALGTFHFTGFWEMLTCL